MTRNIARDWSLIDGGTDQEKQMVEGHPIVCWPPGGVAPNSDGTFPDGRNDSKPIV